MKKRALVSVFDKNGIQDLCTFLHTHGWEILSTGGTAAYLKEHGIPVTDISSVTGFPECLEVTAIDDNGQIMGLRHRHYNIHGIQFHPESVLTPNGRIIMQNWLSL